MKLTIALRGLLALMIAAAATTLADRAAAREIHYAEAYAAAQEGAPLTILCHAEYCGPCKTLRARLNAAGVVFVAWDIEHPEMPAIHSMIYTGGNIPQLWVYQRTAGKWTRTPGKRP